MENQKPTEVPLKSSKFPLTAILGILVLILIGLSGYLFYLNQSLKKELISLSPSPIATSIPTNNWSTYVNSKYGYSFKYPSDLIILGVENGLGLTDITKESTGVDLDNSNFEISIKGDVLTKNYIAQEKQKGMTQSKIAINNIEATVFESSSSKDYLLPHPDGEHTVIIRTSKNFDQILSTFKFLDENTSDIPKPILDLFISINDSFKTSIKPIEETQFYSQTGMVNKQSWKLNLINTPASGKEFTTFLRTLLSPNDQESGGIGGGGIEAYENNQIKCFHSYMSYEPNIHNTFSCALK